MTDLLLQLKNDRNLISQLVLKFDELEQSVKLYNKYVQNNQTDAQNHFTNNISPIISTLETDGLLCDIFKLIRYFIKYKNLIKEPEPVEEPVEEVVE